MKLLLSLLALFPLVSLSAQTIENGDFSKGKTNWIGDGKIVYLKEDGALSDTATPGAEKVLQIELKKNRWSFVRQTFHPLAKDTSVSVQISALSRPDFAPLEESREYSKEKWNEGGSYVWSAEVWPKCQFLVRLQDSTWYYRLFSLAPSNAWKDFNFTFDKLESRNRSLTVAVPPGSGSVLFRFIK